MTAGAMYKPLLVAIALLILFGRTAYAQDSSYVPTHEMPDGQELVFVYLGSYSCGPCQSPEMKRAIEEAKLLLSQGAKEVGKSFSAVGADMGWDVEQGIAFLKGSGQWDEIMVGRSWIGSAASRYIWKERVSAPIKPSIVVYEREVEQSTRGIRISEPDYLVSKSGVDQIIEWVEAGVPLK